MRYALIVLYAASACQQRQSSAPAPPAAIAFDGASATNSAALRAHGERLSHVLGCTSCHGARLEGEQFEPSMTQYGPIYASNLTVVVPEYSDAQLDGIIRQGRHPERKSVWVMPSQIFQHLTNADFVALIAYLRSLKPIGTKLPPPQFSKLDKEEIASGRYKPAPQVVRETQTMLPVDVGPARALGRYIAEVTCAECHGPRLEGEKPPRPGAPPDLVVAGAYPRAEFDRLMTTGIASGNRKLNPMMSGVAKYRFSHLTPHERDALYDYLKARAERPQ